MFGYLGDATLAALLALLVVVGAAIALGGGC